MKQESVPYTPWIWQSPAPLWGGLPVSRLALPVFVLGAVAMGGLVPASAADRYSILFPRLKFRRHVAMAARAWA